MIGKLLASEQRTAIERWCRDRAMAVPMPSGDTLCRVLGEFRMVVTLEDLSVAPHLALDGYWEIWNAMCLAKRIKPGWNCIDVGANLGYYTLLLAELAGAEGRVEAWEPALDLAPRLWRTISLSGMRGLGVVACAASDRAHESMLVRPSKDNFGSGAIDKNWERGGQESVLSVHCQRIDEATTLERVDFMKIDAEGHEPEVFRGMEKILARGEPKAMLIEWSPKKYADARAFLAELRRHFELSVVSPDGDLLRPPADEDLVAAEGHLDLFLARPG